VRTLLHRRHGDVLADGSGDDDHWNIEAGALDDGERRRRAEAGEVVVGDDEVPARPGERCLEIRGVVDPLALRHAATLAQLAQQQHRIVFGVLDQQDPQHAGHVVSSRRAAGR
jgi:hypothetical protein